MTKSASRNRAVEQSSRDKHQLTVACLVIQAIALMCLLIYYYYTLSAPILGGVLAWAFISLALATLQIRGHISPSVPHSLPDTGASKDGVHIFGVPGKQLDLAALCSIMQEGAALLKNGHIIFVNPALAYILAAQEEEIVGTRISSYVHPEDAGLMNLEGGTSAGTPSRSTLRLNTRLGDVCWVICSAHNVDWQGNGALLLLFENIGALKQTQQALEEQEHQSRILLERTPLGIAMFDSMGRLRLSNTAWHALWSSIVGNGRRFNILQDPFLPNTPVERAIRQAFGKKDAGISNFEHAAPWGETRWLNLNFHPMTDSMGKLIGVAMIQQDITDHIRSARRENELNDQLTSLRHEVSYTESFLRQIQDKAGYVIISFTQDGTISGWNNYAETRFGLPASKALGLNYRKLGVDFSPYIPLIQQAITQKHACSMDGFERFDKTGLHCEKILVDTMLAGVNSSILLKIQDVTHEVLDKEMRAGLASLATVLGTSRALQESLDISANPPVLKPDGKWGELTEAVSAINAYAPQSPYMCYIPLGELMDVAMQEASRHLGPGVEINGEYSDPALEIFTSPELISTQLCELGKILIRLIPEGQTCAVKLNQSKDRFYAIVSISVSSKDTLGVTDLQKALSRLREDFTCITRDDSSIGKLMVAIQSIAASGGIIGGYSTTDESGFTCRFRLPGLDDPIAQCK